MGVRAALKLVRLRKPLALALLVCVTAQPVIAGSALFELGGGHPHRASVVREDGHVHLVLSHDGHHEHHEHSNEASESPDHWRVPQAELGHGSLCESDHVFELADDAALNASARRSDESPALAFVMTRLLAPSPPRHALTLSSPEPRAADVRRLRTIVLRL